MSKKFSISVKAQKELLAIARRSIEYYLKNNEVPKISTADKELSVPSAVFVTLTSGGALRGCIGTTVAEAPLYQEVSRMAVSAALEDYRFYPLTLEELADVKIEISVLSPMRRVNGADEIIQNEHGVVVRCGRHSGLFLPRVWEHFKNKEDFLCELCLQKAGLEPSAWKDGTKTELHTFTVFAFEEK